MVRTYSARQQSVTPEFVSSGIWLNTKLLGLIMGLGLGIGLFVFTHLSILVTDQPGRYLNLLGVFLFGYEATPAGAWAGLVWGFVFGALSGAYVYQVYARTADVAHLIQDDEDGDKIVHQPVLRLSGHALGLALGSLTALQLFIATTWLVMRGTAGESIHAALWSHYLPGYHVSLVGGLLGGLSLFVAVYLFAHLFAAVYNGVVRLQGPGRRQ
ncbi:MAG: hypothetical protein RIM84_26355 [Alphaproteobacteria bacterium]